MYFSDDIIGQAYFSCPVPSESDNGIANDYLVLMDVLGRQFYELHKTLSPEHLKLVNECFETFHMHSNLISRFYFECGWMAAKEDNELDHF